MEVLIHPLTDPAQRSKTCETIIRALPEWFGIENANQQFIREASDCPAISARHAGQIFGLLLYKPYADPPWIERALDIHFLGLLPEFHRQGVGRRLVSALTAIATLEGINCLTVETLDPDAGDDHYSRTFAFYEHLGFSIYGRFRYNASNPMVRMRLQLDRS